MMRRDSTHLRKSVVASRETELRDDKEEMIEQTRLHACEENQFNGLCRLRVARMVSSGTLSRYAWLCSLSFILFQTCED